MASSTHAVLVMAALAICAVTAAQLKDRTGTQAPLPVRPDQPPPAEPGMIPLTTPEIKRLLAALTARPLPPWLVIHWDAWTRRHQARSRWFHTRARLIRNAEASLITYRHAAALLVGSSHWGCDLRQSTVKTAGWTGYGRPPREASRQPPSTLAPSAPS